MKRLTRIVIKRLMSDVLYVQCFVSDVLCKHALCPDTQTAFCYLFKRPMFLCPMFCVSMRYVRTHKPPFVICLNHKTADVKSTSVQCSLATSRATVCGPCLIVVQ